MVNKKAQEYLNEKYPKNGVCKRDGDKENKGKRREEMIVLDISKGRIGNNLFSDGKVLTGSLELEGFTNLRKLIISSHQLTSLDVINCFNLEELDCHGNQLTRLNVNNCSNLEIINCSDTNI